MPPPRRLQRGRQGSGRRPRCARVWSGASRCRCPIEKARGQHPIRCASRCRSRTTRSCVTCPWDQMQAFTASTVPPFAAASDVVTIDALRRGALAMANQLARASDGFQRHCRLAGSLFATAPHSELEDALTIWIEAAVRIAAGVARAPHAGDAERACRSSRESASSSTSTSASVSSRCSPAPSVRSPTSSSRRAPTPLASRRSSRTSRPASPRRSPRSSSYREARGFTNADPSVAACPRALPRSREPSEEALSGGPLPRAGDLSRPRSAPTTGSRRFVAVMASTWAFIWQIALISRRATRRAPSSSVSCILALLAGLVYAGKDRIKEIGHSWMTRRVQRVWGAQRISRYRAPHRRLPDRDVVVTARESFHQRIESLPDPLNPRMRGVHADHRPLL